MKADVSLTFLLCLGEVLVVCVSWSLPESSLNGSGKPVKNICPCKINYICRFNLVTEIYTFVTRLKLYRNENCFVGLPTNCILPITESNSCHSSASELSYSSNFLNHLEPYTHKNSKQIELYFLKIPTFHFYFVTKHVLKFPH